MSNQSDVYKKDRLYVDVLNKIVLSASDIECNCSELMTDKLHLKNYILLDNCFIPDINNKLYRQGDNLFWNGIQLDGGGGGGNVFWNMTVINNLNSSNVFINRALYTSNIISNDELNIYGNIRLHSNILANNATIDDTLYVGNIVSTGNINLDSNLVSTGWISLNETFPINTANTLYNQTGNLYWNGIQLDSKQVVGNTFDTLTANTVSVGNLINAGNINLNSNLVSTGWISLNETFPINTANTLYNQTGNLYWNGIQLDSKQVVGNTFDTLTANTVSVGNLINVGNINLNSNLVSTGWISLNETFPINTANTLYNQSGNLYWNGFQLYQTNQSSLILEQNTYKWKIEVDGTNGDLVFKKYNGTNYVEKQRFS